MNDDEGRRHKRDRPGERESSSGRSFSLSQLTIEPYQPSQHSRSAFRCGNAMLDDWLKKRAKQHQKNNLSKTYVLVDSQLEAEDGVKDIFGYYCLSNHAVRYETLPEDQRKGLPSTFQMPTALIGRLAVDSRFHRQKLGQRLLIDAAKNVLNLTGRIGIHALEVDAIDENAVAFYKAYDFVPLQDRPTHLILPMKTIKRWFTD